MFFTLTAEVYAMTAAHVLPTVNLKEQVSAAEWQTRVDLAACYRLIALYGWDDLIFTHISAKVPGSEEFLINPFGLMFHEITASSLVKIDLAGNKLMDSPFEINPAGYTIHGTETGPAAAVTAVAVRPRQPGLSRLRGGGAEP